MGDILGNHNTLVLDGKNAESILRTQVDKSVKEAMREIFEGTSTSDGSINMSGEGNVVSINGNTIRIKGSKVEINGTEFDLKGKNPDDEVMIALKWIGNRLEEVYQILNKNREQNK